ncbi:MAG: helix-turn-helix domain-containing protein [Clostridia bacterium]|nr:helix-turn-helix domain-containing protein [Clostridia bacterium]
MKLCEISPFIRQAIIRSMKPGLYTSRGLKTRDCRLFYILHGNGEIIVEGRAYTIKAGTVILFQAGTEYVWQITDMRYISVNFDYTQAYSHIKTTFSPLGSAEFPSDNFSQRIEFSDAPALNRESVFFDGAAFESRITNLAVEINTQGAFRDELLSALLKSVIISIVRLTCEEGGGEAHAGPLLARRVIAYIQENYSRPIKSGDIAAHFHFNPSYLNRVFKAHTGCTVRTFIVDYRISQAMEILRTEALSISETAGAVGFSDVPHFIKTFRAHTGKTPLAYRNAKA